MSFIAWKEINWPIANSRVLRYQTRIFKASKNNNICKVRGLQKRLLKSLDAKLVAIKQVINLIESQKTLTINKQIILTNLQKKKLIKRLKLAGKTLPIEQVSTDKLHKLEKPFINSYKIEYKAKQALCKIVLAPEWEAKFEANSYGFRPGRNCQDTIEAIFLSLRSNSIKNNSRKYVLGMYIDKCYNQFNHEYLIHKLNTLPEIEMQIKIWLNEGILEQFLEERNRINILENIMDVSQKEIISPLLCNIAFHGLEKFLIKSIFIKCSFTKINKNIKQKSFTFIRYANNLIVIHNNEIIIHKMKKKITKWLWNNLHLKIDEKQTFIRNTNNSFDFLGFTFITINKSNISRIKIYPSRNSQTLLLLKVRNIIQNNRNVSAYNLINLLRPVIIKWASYYKYSKCLQIFKKLTHLISQMLRAWVFRRDTRNGRNRIKQRYFPSNQFYTFNGTKYFDNWILNGKQINNTGLIKKNWLPHMSWVKTENWVKIKGVKSPFDGDTLYWEKYIQIKNNWTLKQCKLMKLQNGFCPWCKTKLFFNSIGKVNYIVPFSMGGKAIYTNLQLLHKHCHIEKRIVDGSLK